MHCLEPILNVGLQSNRIVARLVSEFSETNRLTLTSALVIANTTLFRKMVSEIFETIQDWKWF